jgi:hypothetical protein
MTAIRAPGRQPKAKRRAATAGSSGVERTVRGVLGGAELRLKAGDRRCTKVRLISPTKLIKAV